LETLNVADSLVYVTTYQSRNKNPFQSCNPEKFTEDGYYSISINITPRLLFEQFEYFGNIISIPTLTSETVFPLDMENDQSIPTDVLKYLLQQGKVYQYKNGYAKVGINSLNYMGDDDEDVYENSSNNQIKSVALGHLNYRLPWSVTCNGNDVNVQILYSRLSEDEPLLHQKFYLDKRDHFFPDYDDDDNANPARYGPLNLPVLDKNINITQAQVGLPTSFSFNLNTVFSAIALNKDLISNSGFVILRCQNSFELDTCHVRKSNENDEGENDSLTTTGLQGVSYGVSSINVTWNALLENQQNKTVIMTSTLTWVENAIAYKYNLFKDEMTSVYCVQNKTFLPMTTTSIYYESPSPTTSCGFSNNLKFLIPALTFNTYIQPAGDNGQNGLFNNYVISLVFKSDNPLFENNHIGSSMKLLFTVLNAELGSDTKSITLDSGYPIMTFTKVWNGIFSSMSHTNLTMPSYDITKKTSKKYFWRSSPLDSGETENIYFCYQTQGTVLMNTAGSTYSTTLLFHIFLIPVIIYLSIFLIRCWHGQDVATLYYTVVSQDEDPDSKQTTEDISSTESL